MCLIAVAEFLDQRNLLRNYSEFPMAGMVCDVSLPLAYLRELVNAGEPLDHTGRIIYGYAA